MWEGRDWLLAAVVTITTLLLTKGWPLAQWLIEFTRKSNVEDKTYEERQQDRNNKIIADGYVQVIARLDASDKIKTDKIAQLEHDHQECLQASARLEERVKNLEAENNRQHEHIDALLAWKRSRGGSDAIEKMIQPTQPKEKK